MVTSVCGEAVVWAGGLPVLAGDFPLVLVLSSGSLPLHLCDGPAMHHPSWALELGGVGLGVGCPGSLDSFGGSAGVFLAWVA
jgi:hypothetical protein